METQYMASMLSHQVMPAPDQVNGWHCKACGTTTCTSLLSLPACGHRFCMSCMDLWLWEYVSKHGGHGRRYPCQVCWEMYQIPPDGLEAFVQNINVLRLEMELQKLTMTAPGGGGLGGGGVGGGGGGGMMMMGGGQTLEEQNGNSVGIEVQEQSMDFGAEEKLSKVNGTFAVYEENCRPGNNCALVPYCQLPTHMF